MPLKALVILSLVLGGTVPGAKAGLLTSRA